MGESEDEDDIVCFVCLSGDVSDRNDILISFMSPWLKLCILCIWLFFWGAAEIYQFGARARAGGKNPGF